MTTEEQGDYLTVQDAAAALTVSESAIRNALLDGRLPFVTKYGRKLISRAEVEAYKARTQPGGVKLVKGRPPGSKNKEKVEPPADAAQSKPE
jgi:excisionase family DNA binding protein